MSPMEHGLPGADWRKARRSVGNGACVEVATGPAAVLVRDSVNPTGTVIGYPARSWLAFVADAKSGAMDGLR